MSKLTETAKSVGKQLAQPAPPPLTEAELGVVDIDDSDIPF